MTKKRDKIYQFIESVLRQEDFPEKVLSGHTIGIDAIEIERKMQITRNNASTYLNQLWREGKLIKINSRPVSFIPRALLEKIPALKTAKQEYTMAEIKGLLAEQNNKNSLNSDDPFHTLIGANSSLKPQIDQAKAALLYPPNGLHTLILGATGVGKTTFAHVMYEYVRKSKAKTTAEFPLVSFNCSDYFNNPQLLLSQLFGHVKGSFTGADKDKTGCVEKADGGILFLDEVHRLTPDGQEMLFFLMDKGEFYRLGETGEKRKSTVLIIAATTENPESFLLNAFLRRFSIIITLPSLNEKTVSERLEIIEHLFREEAIQIKKNIYITPEVIRALLLYKCTGNIGKLKSNIKLLCAKSFLQSIQNNDQLQVVFNMLPQAIKDAVQKAFPQEKQEIVKYAGIFKNGLNVYPAAKETKGSPFMLKQKEDIYENIYENIAATLDLLKKQGLNQKDIDRRMSGEIESYFRNVFRKYDYHQFDIQDLNKFVHREIIDFTLELVGFASEELKRGFSKKTIYCFALHLNSLIERIRIKKATVNPRLIKIKEMYPKEYEVATLVVERISQRYNLDIPEDENSFIAILLANFEKQEEGLDTIGIVVIAHGDNTASSIAKACNSLLKTGIVKAIDMPLDQDVDRIYAQALKLVKEIDRGKGVLLMVDMGSLIELGPRITAETGIITYTLDWVSTPLLLEAIRKVRYNTETIEEIYQSLLGSSGSYKYSGNKEKALLSVCLTGMGTSLMLRNMLNKVLAENKRKDITIIPLDYNSIEEKSQKFIDLCNQYNILAIVGNIKPQLNIPYFPMEDLFNEDFKNHFLAFLDNTGGMNTHQDHSCYDKAKEVLEEHLLFLNPKRAIVNIEKFLEALEAGLGNFDEAFIIKFTIHLGCMIERIVQGHRVNFEGAEEYILHNQERYLIIRKAAKIMEDFYGILITDNEICYMIKILNNR